MAQIHFNNPNTSPEAFDADWQEWNRAIEAGFPMERAPEDFIREAAEEAGEPAPVADDDDEPHAPDEDERDGDAESALASAGWGTDEDYGGGTHDWEDGGEW